MGASTSSSDTNDIDLFSWLGDGKDQNGDETKSDAPPPETNAGAGEDNAAPDATDKSKPGPRKDRRRGALAATRAPRPATRSLLDPGGSVFGPQTRPRMRHVLGAPQKTDQATKLGQSVPTTVEVERDPPVESAERLAERQERRTPSPKGSTPSGTGGNTPGGRDDGTSGGRKADDRTRRAARVSAPPSPAPASVGGMAPTASKVAASKVTGGLHETTASGTSPRPSAGKVPKGPSPKDRTTDAASPPPVSAPDPGPAPAPVHETPASYLEAPSFDPRSDWLANEVQGPPPPPPKTGPDAPPSTGRTSRRDAPPPTPAPPTPSAHFDMAQYRQDLREIEDWRRDARWHGQKVTDMPPAEKADYNAYRARRKDIENDVADGIEAGAMAGREVAAMLGEVATLGTTARRGVEESLTARLGTRFKSGDGDTVRTVADGLQATNPNALKNATVEARTYVETYRDTAAKYAANPHMSPAEKHALADEAARTAAYHSNDGATKTVGNTAVRSVIGDMLRGLGTLTGVDSLIQSSDAIEAALPQEAPVYADLRARRNVAEVTEVAAAVTVAAATMGFGTTATVATKGLGVLANTHGLATDAGKAARTVKEMGGSPAQQTQAAIVAGAISLGGLGAARTATKGLPDTGVQGALNQTFEEAVSHAAGTVAEKSTTLFRGDQDTTKD